MNRKNLVIILLVILLGVLIFMLFPRENEVTYTEEEKEWIIENEDEIFFMGYYNSPGEAIFVKKLCKILSKETGLNIVPYEDTWYNNMWLLKRGKLQMCSTMDITPQRLKYVKYTQPFKGLSAGIYSTFNDPIDQYENIKGKNIGVIKGVKLLNVLEERYKGISFNVILYDDMESMIDDLRSWEIDGYISTKNYDESTRDFYYFEIPSVSKNNNHIGIHKDYPELYSIIAKEVNYLIDIGWSDAIKEAINFELEKQNLPFNEIEMGYLAENPVMKIGLIDGYTLSGNRKDYLVDGIIPNIFKKIEFLTGMECQYFFDSYENLLKNKDIDLILTVKKDNDNYIYSNPIFSYKISVLGKKDMGFIKEIYDLEPYKLGVFANGYENKYLIEQMPNINIKEYNDFNELLNSIKTLKNEYVLLPDILVDVYISQFKDLRRKGILYERFNYMMAENNKAPLINIINKCLAVIDMDSVVYEEIEDLYNYRNSSKGALAIKIGIIIVILATIINLIIKKGGAQFKLIYTDRRTGINNRLWLEKKLKKDIDKYVFFQVKLKDLFILYESYGLKIYERILKKAIKSIKENLNESDILAIIDKETFIIAKENISDAKAEIFAKDLERSFGEKVLIYDMSYNFKNAVGWLNIDEDINDFDTLMECLNIAVYFSEKENKVVKYSYEIFSKYKDKFDFDKEFVRAVMNEKLMVLYRNVYDKSGEVFALDTSVTCYLKDYGDLNSKTFYQAAKRLNLRGKVDAILLKKIFNQLKEWNNQGKAIGIIVDLVDETIEKKSFIHWLMETIEKFEKIKLIIKLDEETIEDNIEQILFLEHERISFLVNNFGGKVLNTVEIKDIPVDIVCIDSDYILNIGENELYDDALNYIISLAKKSNKKVMVSDIVSKNQYDIIMKKNIDYVEGSYIKPYVKGEDIFYEYTNC
ncbi:EAL domain-containing protein [Maledivibacter halophilus]|uniref:EAL domain, c-di-GMP-specific phosphodiesterase class I (Or its enzymatically inactive variant) n=1 Tax=Maledivibacter halophilus TaxID=36842 RepID=A0A1T5IC85_9FIRM|nr:transporter substrate-binding domain-containing protein [Maledivibacter halophilus]SKC36796.1 EAL domain, c-di-GMP-specific phosphodiesterase class I (or its enzymatically inactive variant) [Maledivibacter halophilus]